NPIITVDTFADVVLGQKLDVHKGESCVATKKKDILYPLPTNACESGIVDKVNLPLCKIVSVKFVETQLEVSKRIFVQPFQPEPQSYNLHQTLQVLHGAVVGTGLPVLLWFESPD